jgi:hypothetical protein
MKKRTIVVIVLLVLFVFVVPAMAGLMWQHKLDTTYVRVDLGPNSDKLTAYGWDSYAMPGGTLVAVGNIDCPTNLYGRIAVVVPNPTMRAEGADIRYLGICAQMTPTPAGGP